MYSLHTPDLGNLHPHLLHNSWYRPYFYTLKDLADSSDSLGVPGCRIACLTELQWTVWKLVVRASNSRVEGQLLIEYWECCLSQSR